ncbi:MBL fold metallo-hydrolase [Thermodesulfobacteriota bacterium]
MKQARMKITLLGTGGPKPETGRQGAGISVQVGDETLLFDAGRGITTQLVKAGIPPERVNPIFITHHHFDHIGNLGDLILSAWINGRKNPLFIFGPKGTTGIIAALLNGVYGGDIAFRLAVAASNKSPLADIRDLVQVTEAGAGLIHDSGKYRVYGEDVEHGHGLGISRDHWTCLGYRVEAEGKTVAISGDTVACEGINHLAKNADVLIQCCYLAEAEITNRVDERISKYILASSQEAGKIAARTGVKKLVLTHFREKSREMMDALLKDVQKGYKGTVCLGEDLMVIDL